MENFIKEYYKIGLELSQITESLYSYYPKKTDDFLDLMVGLYRKNYLTLSGILKLSEFPSLGDSTMALARKIIEDVVAYHWIKFKGKEKWAKTMKKFYYMQFHQQYEFLLQLDIKPDIFTEDSKKMLDKYNEIKGEFIFNKKTGEEQRSWSGKNTSEKMIEELHKNGVFNKQINKLIGQGYVYGSWKTHLNPYDLQTYLTSTLHSIEVLECTKKALGIGTILFLYLSSNYIEDIRFLNDTNLFKELKLKLKKILNQINKIKIT